MEKTIHQGRQVKRIREILQVKQQTLASALGEDWTQKKVSLLEDKTIIDAALMEDIAKALQIPVDAIKNFDEQQAITIISSTFNDNAAVINNNPTFHPIDKLIQLHEEKIALYERMLKEKDDMMAKLETLLGK